MLVTFLNSVFAFNVKYQQKLILSSVMCEGKFIDVSLGNFSDFEESKNPHSGKKNNLLDLQGVGC